MSRSGYTDDLSESESNLYRNALNRALRGKRGVAFLREMAAALDAMPVKRLICGEFGSADGEVCALGAVAIARGIRPAEVRTNNVTDVFDIAESIACKIMHNNDECGPVRETPEQRWVRMRAWVARHLEESGSAK